MKPVYYVDGEPGIQPVATRASLLDRDIAALERAYNAVHDARWQGPLKLDARLAEAIELVWDCLRELDRERRELREKEQTRGTE